MTHTGPAPAEEPLSDPTGSPGRTDSRDGDGSSGAPEPDEQLAGHPNLQRIMLPDDWQGHPLRRTEPLGSEPVDFTVTRKMYGTD